MISPFVLPKIGVSAARELFLTGMRFTAHQAKAIGLVHAVVPEAELDATVDRYVTELLSAAPTGVAAAKRLIPLVWGRTPDQVADLTANAIAEQRASPEGQEGLRAFLEKRKPEWA
jgi:methylglutaconyl-CoA hydratase